MRRLLAIAALALAMIAQVAPAGAQENATPDVRAYGQIEKQQILVIARYEPSLKSPADVVTSDNLGVTMAVLEPDLVGNFGAVIAEKDLPTIADSEHRRGWEVTYSDLPMNLYVWTGTGKAATFVYYAFTYQLDAKDAGPILTAFTGEKTLPETVKELEGWQRVDV